jgi:hypothetical protein
MLPVGSEPTIPASEQPQTYALHRAVTGIDTYESHTIKYIPSCLGSRMFIYVADVNPV